MALRTKGIKLLWMEPAFLERQSINCFDRINPSYGYGGANIYDFLINKEVLIIDENKIKTNFKKVVEVNGPLLLMLKIPESEFKNTVMLINQTKSLCVDDFFCAVEVKETTYKRFTMMRNRILMEHFGEQIIKNIGIKPILYIDMDGVVADFLGAVIKIEPNKPIIPGENADWVYDVCINNPKIFHELDPIPGAIEAVKELFDHYDIYFLSVPMWCVPDSFTGKRLWLEAHFGVLATDRLILTSRKDFNIGHFLIDDRLKHGVDKFKGEHIHFGTEKFPDWASVVNYLLAY